MAKVFIGGDNYLHNREEAERERSLEAIQSKARAISKDNRNAKLEEIIETLQRQFHVQAGALTELNKIRHAYGEEMSKSWWTRFCDLFRGRKRERVLQLHDFFMKPNIDYLDVFRIGPLAFRAFDYAGQIIKPNKGAYRDTSCFDGYRIHRLEIIQEVRSMDEIDRVEIPQIGIDDVKRLVEFTDFVRPCFSC